MSIEHFIVCDACGKRQKLSYEGVLQTDDLEWIEGWVDATDGGDPGAIPSNYDYHLCPDCAGKYVYDVENDVCLPIETKQGLALAEVGRRLQGLTGGQPIRAA